MTALSLSAADLFSVKDMVFVITGGGSGLGKIMAHALDQNGAAKVYILGRRLDKLQEVAKEAKSGSLVPIQCDATSKDDLAAAASRVEKDHGFVNAVIANSGILGPSLSGLKEGKTEDYQPTLEEIQQFLWKPSQESFTETFAVNDTAMFYTCVAFLHLLDAGNKLDSSPTKSQGIKSQFIATSSIAGFLRQPFAGFSYSGSKSATTHLVKNLATYLIPYHIRCNLICPGLYPSEMSRLNEAEVIKEGAIPSKVTPLTRAGAPHDIAGAVLSLCGMGGSYYNGHVVVTDGGRISGLPATY